MGVTKFWVATLAKISGDFTTKRKIMKKRLINGLLATTIAFAVTPAQSETIPGTSVSVHFESTHIVGSGRTLNMHRVPVRDVNTGETTYYDVSFDFTFSPEKGFIFEQMSSVAISPPLFSITSLVVGIYRDVEGYCFELESPIAFTDNRSLYLFKAVTGISGCRKSSSQTLTAQITSGPAVGHPGIEHRSIVKDLPDTYVYGIIADGQASSSKINRSWDPNYIIGLRQTGGNLTVARFTTFIAGSDKDVKTPVQTVILEKVELE